MGQETAQHGNQQQQISGHEDLGSQDFGIAGSK
jgi:hypothetical protein